MGEEVVYYYFAKVLPHEAKTLEDVLACEVSLPCGNSVALNQLPLATVRFASRDQAEAIPKGKCGKWNKGRSAWPDKITNNNNNNNKLSKYPL